MRGGARTDSTSDTGLAISSFLAMKKLDVLLVLLVAVSNPACSQGPWTYSMGETEIQGGTILSPRYEAPNDSGLVHLVFVSLDSTLCYSGFRGVNRFPPLKDFELQTRWSVCEADSTTVSDSASVIYRGEEGIVFHDEERENVDYGDVVLVTYRSHGESDLRRLQSLRDIKELPEASQMDLKGFLRDNLGWSQF